MVLGGGSVGIILIVLGAFISLIINVSEIWHQKVYTNPWKTRYWWMGWRPFYKNTKTLKWHMKLNSRVVRYGAIPPKVQWNIIAFLLVIIGSLLQIIG